MDQIQGFPEADKQLSTLSTQQQTYMTSKRSLVKNGTNTASDGASAASGGNSKAASSNRYAMLANIAEDDDVEDNNQKVSINEASATPFYLNQNSNGAVQKPHQAESVPQSQANQPAETPSTFTATQQMEEVLDSENFT